MNRVEFQEQANNIIKHTNCTRLRNWRLKIMNDILKDQPFEPKKADTFVSMIEYGFDVSLYFRKEHLT